MAPRMAVEMDLKNHINPAISRRQELNLCRPQLQVKSSVSLKQKDAALADNSNVLWQNRGDSSVKHRFIWFSLLYNHLYIINVDTVMSLKESE